LILVRVIELFTNKVDLENYHKALFNQTSSKNQQGIYYESHGGAKLSHFCWDLVISLDVQLLISKYDIIMAHYETTMTICKKIISNFGSVEIEEICSLFIQQFTRATMLYLNDIETNHRSFMLAIFNDGNRVR